MKQFYAYLWLREDGTPYYAGKGSGQRAYIRGSHHLKPPEDRTRILIFERASEMDAISTERELIFNWGRKDLGAGCLRNFTDGGDGVSGLKHSDSARQAMSAGHKGRPSWNKGLKQTPEHIAKLSAVRKGKNKGLPRPAHVMFALHSSEAIAKSAAARTGRKLSEITKEKIRLSQLGRKISEDTRKKLVESHKGCVPSLETHQRLSESGKNGWLLRRKKCQILVPMGELT